MILYRVILNANNISNPKINGLNSFNYQDNIEYLHFYILPENAEIIQLDKYYQGISTYILKCDIPYEIIKDNFGVGLYTWYYRFKKVPFLEVRIKKEDFIPNFIIDKSGYINALWKNHFIFERYLINCIYNQTVFTYIDKSHSTLKLRKDFNFLHYFSRDDLKKAGLSTESYPEDINFSNLKKKKLLLFKRLLIDVKENIEMNYDFDGNVKK